MLHDDEVIGLFSFTMVVYCAKIGERTMRRMSTGCVATRQCVTTWKIRCEVHWKLAMVAMVERYALNVAVLLLLDY